MAAITPDTNQLIEMIDTLRVADTHLDVARQTQREARDDLLKSIREAFVALSSQNASMLERLEQTRSRRRELEMTLQAQLKEAEATLNALDIASAKQLEDNIAIMKKQQSRHAAEFTQLQEAHVERRSLDVDLLRLRHNDKLLKEIVVLSEGNIERPGVCPIVIAAVQKASFAIL